MHRRWLCVSAALTCLFVQVGAARNIFLTAGDFSVSNVATYSSDPLTFGTDIGGLGGSFLILPSASPTKYYSISKSATETVSVLEGRFPNLAVGRRISVVANASAAAVTPDGRRLIVVGPGGVQIIDTATESTLVLIGNLDVGTDPIDVATSLDSTRAYVLSAASARLTAIDLATNQVAGSVRLGTRPSSVAVGPNGVVYVSAQSAVYEIDGYSMQARATIPVNGDPAKLLFTPDGRFALARNLSVFTGRGAFLVDLEKRSAAESLSTGFGFNDVAMVDNRTAYGVGTNGLMYVINIGTDGSLSFAQANFTGAILSGVRDIAVTNELPRGKFLIVLTTSTIQRVELDTNTVTNESAATSFTGTLNVVAPAQSGGFSGFVPVALPQIVAAGTTSQPLVLRVHDQAGRPVAGIPVVFSTTAAGVTLTTTQTTSNFEGYALTRINVPAGFSGGTVEVNASIADGLRSHRFTVRIGDPGLPPGGGSTPTPPVRGLQIVQGHGQVIAENTTTSLGFGTPLQVRYTDANGTPVSGVRVRWSLAQGSGSVRTPETVTDSNGIAEGQFTASGITTGLGTPYLTNSIVAETVAAPGVPAQAVTFFVTTVPSRGDFFGQISVQFFTPGPLRLQAGAVVSNGLQARVNSLNLAAPIPFVGMRVTSSNGDDPNFANASCRGGIALSDAQGNLTCDLVVGPRTGPATLFVVIGERQRYEVPIEVVPGEPARVTILSGANVSGNAGTQLSPLAIQVTDAGGNPLAGIPVQWDIPMAINVTNVSRATDEAGRATATLTLGQNPGTFTVRAIAGAGTATFTIVINANASQIQVVSGGNQNAATGTPFAEPVRFRVLNPQGQPIPNATVNFTITGPGTLSATSATTNNEGIAQVNVTAGGTTGTVIVTAAVGAVSMNANLVVRPAGPSFTAADILDAAGFQPGVAPGVIAFIRARGIATSVTGTVTPGTIVGPLPTTLAGVEVLFNNTPAPIFSVSNVNGEESVVVQVPYEVQPGPASVTIRTTSAGATTLSNVNIQAVKPGVFTFRDSNGMTYAVGVRPDGSYISSSNPARRGELLRVFATGLGQTAPATGTNRVGQAGQSVIAPVIAGVNNAGIRVVSAELQPGSIGLYVVTVEIPQDTAANMNAPFGLAVDNNGSLVFANGTVIPLQ